MVKIDKLQMIPINARLVKLVGPVLDLHRDYESDGKTIERLYREDGWTCGVGDTIYPRDKYPHKVLQENSGPRKIDRCWVVCKKTYVVAFPKPSSFSIFVDCSTDRIVEVHSSVVYKPFHKAGHFLRKVMVLIAKCDSIPRPWALYSKIYCPSVRRNVLMHTAPQVWKGVVCLFPGLLKWECANVFF